MAAEQSSNKALVPIIAIGAALVLGAGLYFWLGGEEPADIAPQPEPQQVSEPAAQPAETKPAPTRTREPEAAGDRTTRTRGPEPTEEPATERERKTRTPKAKEKEEKKSPPALFREPGIG